MCAVLRWIRPSRLALKIYLIGLVQFIIVAAALEVDHQMRHTSPPWAAQGQFVAEGIAKVLDDPPALQAEVERVGRTLAWSIDVREPGGPVLAHADPPPDRRGKTHGVSAVVPIHGANGRMAEMAYVTHPKGHPQGPPWVGLPGVIVLLVVGVAAWLTSRSLARPLQKLATITRAFGKGQLDTRANMNRADEIGEVAKAFDDMAERIAKLLHAERELLANVSHELRTPLARIRVALDLASEADPRHAMESLQEIAQDLAELERIVDDVLASARLALDASAPASRPTMLVRTERLDTEALLDKSVARFKAAHPERRLDVRLGRGLPAIMADAVLIRRVFDNLLDNAHKYTEEAKEPIALEARADGDAVVIEVKDHGIGIDEADLGRLFEPFFRADRSRTRSTGGLGLGLALARRVVDAHNGSITFTSELGTGTVARVRLPGATA
jgi:signal transduction histidine kinase